MAKSIRKQLEEAMVTGLVTILADQGWRFDEDNIGAEPSELPLPDKNFIGFRILNFNQHMSSTPDSLYPDAMIQDVMSTVRFQSYGPTAYVWLDYVLMTLCDEDVIDMFADLGFSVVGDMAGLQDISQYFGGETQLRGTTQIFVSCRAVRDRVITFVDTIEVDLAVKDPNGVYPDLTSNLTADVSEP
jgi:hypothetical protein